MGREDVEREMKETLGMILSIFDRIPDEFLDPEWDLVKRLQLGETIIPNKYKELIGLAVAAATRSRTGVMFHTELARLNGANDAEVAEAVHFAKLVSGWDLLLAGLQVDGEQIARQVGRVVATLERDWR